MHIFDHKTEISGLHLYRRIQVELFTYGLSVRPTGNVTCCHFVCKQYSMMSITVMSIKGSVYLCIVCSGVKVG